MEKKPKMKMHGPTLQEIELVPNTDPAELEAIDRRRKAAENAIRAAEKPTRPSFASAPSVNQRSASDPLPKS